MGNQMIQTRHDDAVMLHSEIKAKGTVAADALADFCGALKKMRDTGLYVELGHEDFGEYCESELGIRTRQAYNYISSYEKLGADFIRKNAGLGITKLEILSRIAPEEREDAEEKAAEISVSELAELREQLDRANNQISILTSEADIPGVDAEREIEKLKEEYEDKIAEMKEKLNDSEAEIKQLQSETVPAEVTEAEKEAIRTEIESEFKKKAAAEGREKIKAEAEKIAAKKIEDAVKEAEKAATEKAKNKAAERLEKLSAEKSEAEAHIKALQRQLKSSDAHLTAAKIHFSALQNEFNAMMASIGETDGVIHNRLLDAASKVISECLERVRSTPRFAEANDVGEDN